MEKKRGVWIGFLVFLILLASSVMAAGESVSQDIVVGVLVVAIIIIIVVVLLIIILKKKAKMSVSLPAISVPKSESYMIGDHLESPEIPDLKFRKEPEPPQAAQPVASYGGFLAKARSLQAGQQTASEGQKDDQYKVGGFKKEEVDQLLSVPEQGPGQMKTCKGCGFELSADETLCPVCGKKQ